jgi:hypothetical protein
LLEFFELIKETLGKIEKMTSKELESICTNAGYKKDAYYRARTKSGVICWTETNQDRSKIYFVKLPKLKPPMIPGLEKQIEEDKAKIDKLKNQLSQACISLKTPKVPKPPEPHFYNNNNDNNNDDDFGSSSSSGSSSSFIEI